MRCRARDADDPVGGRAADELQALIALPAHATVLEQREHRLEAVSPVPERAAPDRRRALPTRARRPRVASRCGPSSGSSSPGIIAATSRPERSGKNRAEAEPRPSPADDATLAAPPADAADLSPSYESVQRRRDEEVTFAILRAVGSTADVYRDRLRRILEHQDGPAWLDAFQRPPARRHARQATRTARDMDAAGAARGPQLLHVRPGGPAADRLGRRRRGPTALQARQLSASPRPDKRSRTPTPTRLALYSQITGYPAPFDTHGID